MTRVRDQELALAKGMVSHVVSERLDQVRGSVEGLEENMQEMHAQSNKFNRTVAEGVPPRRGGCGCCGSRPTQ